MLEIFSHFDKHPRPSPFNNNTEFQSDDRFIEIFSFLLIHLNGQTVTTTSKQSKGSTMGTVAFKFFLIQ